MRMHRPVFRLTTAATVAAMAFGCVAPALAQQSGGDVAQADALAAGDPPARVGRVGRLSGTVSFHTYDQDHWEPATVNYPITTGNAFWTQPGSTADLDIGSTRITLDSTSEFTIDRLDDQNLSATAAQGHVFVEIRDLAAGEQAVLRTPRGTVRLSQPGRYAIVVGDTERPTLVTVDEGAAEVQGPGVSLNVGPHQTAQISGTDSFTGSVVAQVPDSFMAAQMARPQPMAAPGSLPPPPAVLQMTGYEALAGTGEWEQAPEYGRVWYPPVEPDWVPYRHGRWSWVSPWGWTWVDEAPWGFAPSHYGRWVEIHDRWAWTPVEEGVVYGGRPVYSPALVTFVGAAAGVAVGVGLAAAVGWIPLGPREAYRPSYAASNNYMRRMNGGDVTNITNTTVNNTRYVNNHATTVVQASAMQQSQPIAAQARPATQVQASGFQPVARAPVQPTLATRGVTPVVARSFNLQPAPNAAPVQPVAPGPAFRQRAGTAPALPNGPSPANGPLSVGGPAPAAAPQAGSPSHAGLATGAVIGGAAVLGGAALLNRSRQPLPQGGATPPIAPGSAPGPAIIPRGPVAVSGGAQAGGGFNAPRPSGEAALPGAQGSISGAVSGPAIPPRGPASPVGPTTLLPAIGAVLPAVPSRQAAPTPGISGAPPVSTSGVRPNQPGAVAQPTAPRPGQAFVPQTVPAPAAMAPRSVAQPPAPQSFQQRATPVPQPQVQRPTQPALQPVQQRAAPQPQPQPQPVQRPVQPQPQQRPAQPQPQPVQRPSQPQPLPVQRPAPPPQPVQQQVQRPAPAAPPPQVVHQAPPAPRPAPAGKSCPPGRPNC